MAYMPTRGAFGAICARAASILASFLLTFIVARVLNVEAAASFFLAFTTIAVVATFGRFGTDNLALKIVGGASSNPHGDVRRLFVIATLASALGAALALFVIEIFGLGLPGAGSAALILCATAAIPQALGVVSGAILRARGKLLVGTIAELGSTPTLTIVGILVLVLADAVSLDNVLLSLVVASWVTASWSLFSAWRSMRAAPSSVKARADGFRMFLRRYVRQMLAMMGTSLLFYLVTWIPIFILSVAGDYIGVSYYTTAARLAGFVGLIPAIQVSYLAPTFARLFQQSDVVALNTLAGRSALTALVLAAIPGAILMIWAEPILTLLYGEPYGEAGLALTLLTLGVVLSVAAGQVNQLMLLCDLEQFALGLNVVLLITWVSIGYWAASELGLMGAVYVSLAATIFYHVMAVVSLLRTAGIQSFVRITRVTS